jgi:hypothetical protein
MKPFRAVFLACAFLWLDAGLNPLQAAWDNVFQVSCHRRPAVSYYAPVAVAAAPAACPQPVCTTQYVQRCYYQPVTAYTTRSYYEQVTTQQTSYYYEPVCSYRYSCYFDPCTCSYQQVAVPTTSYRLRAQSCPVTSWVQRCATVPVTTYQQAFYWEPVTTCCTTTVGAPISAVPAPAVGAPAVPAPMVPAPGFAPGIAPPQPGMAPPQPGVSEQRLAPVPGVLEQPGRDNGSGSRIERYYDPMPPASGTQRQSQPRATPATPPPPTVRLDRIVTLPQATVEGQVISGHSIPYPGAQVLFVNMARVGLRQTATADAQGQFRAALAPGEWLVYLPGSDGKPVLHSKLEVRDNEAQRLTLVSRR